MGAPVVRSRLGEPHVEVCAPSLRRRSGALTCACHSIAYDEIPPHSALSLSLCWRFLFRRSFFFSSLRVCVLDGARFFFLFSPLAARPASHASLSAHATGGHTCLACYRIQRWRESSPAHTPIRLQQQQQCHCFAASSDCSSQQQQSGFHSAFFLSPLRWLHSPRCPLHCRSLSKLLLALTYPRGFVRLSSLAPNSSKRITT